VKLHLVEAVPPGLAARIAGAEAGQARRFAFRVARLACALAGVHDANALEVARGGLERYPEIEELVQLWRLERRLDTDCEFKLGTHAKSLTREELKLHSDCAAARAVGAVIAALKPDAIVAARGAAREALNAGCELEDLESIAHQVL